MVYSITILLLSANLLVTKCQEDTPDVDTPDFLIEQVSEHTRHTSPSYSYGYGVQDAKTGDLKTAWEEKEGDTVKGHYSVLEPDGSVRTVQYKADAKSGFNAVVKNEKLNDAPMDLFDSEQVSHVQDPGSYSVMESDGSVRTVLYNTKPKTIFKERPKVIPMDAIDVWHLDHATRMQEHTPYSEHSDSVQYKLDVDSDSIKKEQPNEQIDFVESLRLDNAPRMQDKSLRDYGKLEPAFDYPAFSSVGETDGKPKFPFEEQKDFPQLWSYRDYLKRLADETDNIKKHNKRGSYKKHKHTSLVELDLSHSKYPDKLTAKETSFGEPTPEYSLEKYLAAQSSDLKNKYTSPFSNSPFRLPNIFGGDFGGLKSLTDKYKHKPEPFSDIHEYVSASEIAQSLPELDILKSKRKPYIKHKYPGLLPLPYAGAASTLEDDFIIIPKKKYLEHSKLIDPSFNSYSHLEHNVRDVDDEYEPHHVHDEKCIHNNEKNKEVIVRKYVKKSKKPVINLLDIFDI